MAKEAEQQGKPNPLWGGQHNGFRQAGAFEKGRNKQNTVLKLVQDVKTRWDSTMFMLVRLVKNILGVSILTYLVLYAWNSSSIAFYRIITSSIFKFRQQNGNKYDTLSILRSRFVLLQRLLVKLRHLLSTVSSLRIISCLII
jgi:hypothetical protein